jgi:hypothetical protein
MADLLRFVDDLNPLDAPGVNLGKPDGAPAGPVNP